MMPNAKSFLKRLIGNQRKRERKYKNPVPLDYPRPTVIELSEELLEVKIDRPDAALINPHKYYQFWYKGQIHAHTNSNGDDGEHTPAEVEQAYALKGYDFICLTGHNTLTPPAPGEHRILDITGVESGYWYRHHLLGLDIGTADVDKDFLADSCPCENIQRRIDYLRDRGGIVVLAHPRSGHRHVFWSHIVGLCDEGWSLTDLKQSENYQGIEVFNKALDSRDYWNRLLCSRKKVWGFGVDDFHEPLTGNKKSFNRSWIVVNSNVDSTQANEDILRQDIIQNIKAGNFYTVLRGSDKTGDEDTSGDGPQDDIGPALRVFVSENSVTIHTDPVTDEIRTNEIHKILGKFGSEEIRCGIARFHGDVARRLTHTLSDWGEDWVRFEVEQTRKNEEYLALSQPLFVR